MSKKEKLLAKLRACPTPTDFRWDELITLMNYYGFENSCSGGSHYTFKYKDDFCFSIPRSHPDGILKRYQVDEALEALRRIGVIE